MATHSTEIVNECEPSEVVVINKTWKSARRVTDVEGVQSALEFLGSGHNVTLAQLARTRRIVFVEGEDFKLLRRFAERLGLYELASGFDLTPVPVEGFGQWSKIATLGWGIEKTLGRKMVLTAVFDRDYFPDDEAADIHRQLSAKLHAAFIHRRKEIENYLLVPAAIDRAVERAIRDRARRMKIPATASPPAAADLLRDVTDVLKEDVQSKYVAKHLDFMKRTQRGIDTVTLTTEALRAFSIAWSNFERRLEIVPGKDVFGRLNEALRARTGIGVSAAAIIAAMAREEVPEDLANLLRELDKVRSASPSDTDGRGHG